VLGKKILVTRASRWNGIKLTQLIRKVSFNGQHPKSVRFTMFNMRKSTKCDNKSKLSLLSCTHDDEVVGEKYINICSAENMERADEDARRMR
jgi:hypothetical protein